MNRKTYELMQHKSEGNSGSTRCRIAASSGNKPRYPIYIVTYDRRNNLTEAALDRGGMKWRTVRKGGDEPGRRHNVKGLIEELRIRDETLSGIKQRNHALEHAQKEGRRYAWILDDNIRRFRCFKDGMRPEIGSDGLWLIEQMAALVTDVGIAGPQYTNNVRGSSTMPYVRANRSIYSAMLIRTDLRFRGEYNEDVDICLQAMTKGLGTFRTNCVTIEKTATGRSKGGNEKLYSGWGAIRKTVAIRRQWPDAISIHHKYGRYSHQVNWDAVPDPQMIERASTSKIYNDYINTKKIVSK